MCHSDSSPPSESEILKFSLNAEVSIIRLRSPQTSYATKQTMQKKFQYMYSENVCTSLYIVGRNATYAACERVSTFPDVLVCLELVPRLCDASVLFLFFTFFMTSPQNNWTFVTSSSQDNLLCDVILLSSRITCFNWRTFFNNLNYTFWRRQLYQCIHRAQNAETLSLFIFL